jgi:hypothetical protein
MQMPKSGTLHEMMYIAKHGRKTAEGFKRAIIPESAFSLQYGSGQGIDFFAELVPPPPNQWTLADKRKVLNDFAGRHYESFVDVELLLIPCCGKANICSNKKIISFLSIPREHHVPHSKNMLLWFRAAS